MRIILLLILLGSLYSCQETQEEQKETAVSTFTINPSQRNIVQGKKNGILIIPEDCFVDEEGNVIKEEVEVQLTEAYSIEDMLDYNLETSSPGGLLVSGGMINLEATTISGEKVEIANEKTITLQKTASKLDTNQYQFFTQASEQWDNPEPPNPYLTYLPLDRHPEVYVYLDNRDSPKLEDLVITTIKQEDRDEYRDDLSTRSFLEGAGRYFNGYEPTIISDEVLDKSFLSSKEYQERFAALPPSDEGISITTHLTYLKYLDKPLWVADSMVLKELKKELLYYQKELLENEKDPYYLFEIELTQHFIKVFTAFKNQYKTTFSPDRFTEEELEAINQFYQKLSTDKFIQSFSIRKVGWHNIDFLYEKHPLKSTSLVVTTNLDVEKIALVLKDDKAISQGKRKEVKSFTFPGKLPQVPAYLIALGEEDGKFFFCKKEIKIGQNEVEELELKPSSQEEISKVLEEIEKGYE